LPQSGQTYFVFVLDLRPHLCIADLRWNNVGLVGGRALLAALDHNKTLTRLLLAGNNVPADVLRSLGVYTCLLLMFLLLLLLC